MGGMKRLRRCAVALLPLLLSFNATVYADGQRGTGDAAAQNEVPPIPRLGSPGTAEGPAEEGSAQVLLTDEEQAWIRAHPVIRLGVDPEFAPFEFLDKHGAYHGMASDYVRLLNQRLGLNMAVTPGTSWAEATQLVTSAELDVLPCIAITEGRQKDLLFSESYLTFYRIIVTREDGPFVGSLDDLYGLRVGVQANTSHEGYLRENTKLKPIRYNSLQELLVAVASGKIDAAVGNVATVSYWVRKLGLGNLRTAAPAGGSENHLHFAVRRDWPELVTILNKGLASVTEEEAHAIRQKWVTVSVERVPDYMGLLRLFGLVVALAAAILMLISLHMRSLRKEIRERARAEEAHARSEADYRTLVESANSAILKMDHEGNVVFFNAFAERLFGFPAEEILGKSVVGTIVPASETQGRDLHKLIADMCRSPEDYAVNENENMTNTGERLWMAWTNRPLYDAEGRLKEILCIGTDITVRKEAEDTLFRYEFIVNTVEDMMSVVNSKGVYEAVNSAWCQAIGKNRDDVIGRSINEVWPADVADEAIWTNLRTCLAGDLVSYEAVIHLPTWGARNCEVTFYPCADAESRITHAVVVTHDVTEWRTTQMALQEAKLSAEAANQAKSAFLANMSHEIRTPMNAILGYAQLLRRQRGLSPEQERALAAIHRSGDHLLDLINNVLEMSKIDAVNAKLQPVTFDIQQLFADLEVLFLVRTNAKGIHLVMELDEDVPALVRTDEIRLRQVLVNLIGNAVKFTEHGEIRVHGQVAGQGPNNSRMLAITVQDSGCGIPQDEHALIFESFEQGRAGTLHKGGTGLGLTISRRFAHLMGGDITVESEPGSGSEFRLTFCVQEGIAGDEEPAAQERRVQHLRAGQGVTRVLVIDDCETNRDILCKLLRHVGFEACEASSGPMGIELFTEWEPQVVLVDLVMPGMSGQEVIRRMRSLPHGDSITIIAVTASTLEEDRESVLAEGADAFLRKPFRDDELYEYIREYANVEFEYEEEDTGTGQQRVNPSLSDARQMLHTFPEELHQRLWRAVVTGDVDRVRNISHEIRPRAPDLAGVLERCANDYQLNGIEALFEDRESGDGESATISG